MSHLVGEAVLPAAANVPVTGAVTPVDSLSPMQPNGPCLRGNRERRLSPPSTPRVFPGVFPLTLAGSSPAGCLLLGPRRQERS